MTSMNFNDPEKVLAYHARIKGFESVEEFEKMFKEADKKRKKAKKTSPQRIKIERWIAKDGTKAGLLKVMGKK